MVADLIYVSDTFAAKLKEVKNRMDALPRPPTRGAILAENAALKEENVALKSDLARSMALLGLRQGNLRDAYETIHGLQATR